MLRLIGDGRGRTNYGRWPWPSGLARLWSFSAILLFDDFQVQLPDNYLTKVDVASMAFSLEVRAPLLYAAVLKTAWRLPGRMKLHWRERKWILKRIAARLVLAQTLRELQEHRNRERDNRLLIDSVAEREGWIASDRVIRELQDHCNGVRDNHNRLWLILWLELRFRVVVSGELDHHADLTEMMDPSVS